MKAYKILAVICLALILCLGMMACNENADPVTLHCAAGISEDELKANLVKLMDLPEGTEIEVSGEFDLTASGKYTVTCKWGKKEREASVWVYSNSVNVLVDGKILEGDTVHFNYNKAVASENFTNCITITDSFGNVLTFSKDSKCMQFENKAGLYVMYYNVTDAAGQNISVRVVYDVTYEHYISVENSVAITDEDNATFVADFDGATDVWLEDANGKVDSKYYEIKEDSILLKKEYYSSFVGKRTAIKVCSNNGSTYFYVSVFDAESYADYIEQKRQYAEQLFIKTMSYAAGSVSFTKTTEPVDGINFTTAYQYIKKAGVNADNAQLIFATQGKYAKVSFNLYVRDASGSTAGEGITEFQITKGAKFVSVKDADGNPIPVVSKNEMPHVLLQEGKVYQIVLDLTETLSTTEFRVWGRTGAELYYYNFEFMKCEYEYIMDNVTQTVVCKKDGETYGYFAWPTVTKLDGDRLIAVSSGFRKAHIDNESKVAVWYSEDGGKTWSEPQVLVDTLLDDRDAGVVYWNGKIIVSWFCASKVYYINNNASKYSEWAAGIDDAYDTKYMGGNYIISEDGGKTWSEIYCMPEGMFTPHGLIVNPDGGLTSVGYLKYDKVNKRWGTGIAVRTTTGEMDENGFIWSDPIVIADSDTQYSWDFQEPYGIYNDDGVLIVVMRSDTGLYQCELQPGQTKFSDWHKIAIVQETPAHMFRHSSGVMVMTYGYRGLYKDVNGNTVSYKDRNKDTTTYGIRARLSYDGGLTWTREVILTSGLQATTSDNTSDWGYTSTVELSNGKLLTLYYQRTGSETMASIYQVVWELPEAPAGEITVNFVGGKLASGTYASDGLVIESVSGQFGEEIVLSTEPTMAGYKFEGWYLDYACTMPFTLTTYSKDLTVYAKWTKN